MKAMRVSVVRAPWPESRPRNDADGLPDAFAGVLHSRSLRFRIAQSARRAEMARRLSEQRAPGRPQAAQTYRCRLGGEVCAKGAKDLAPRPSILVLRVAWSAGAPSKRRDVMRLATTAIVANRRGDEAAQTPGYCETAAP